MSRFPNTKSIFALGVSVAACLLTVPLESTQKIVGYFTNWTHYRANGMDFEPATMKSVINQFTHINYAFEFVNFEYNNNYYLTGQGTKFNIFPSDGQAAYAIGFSDPADTITAPSWTNPNWGPPMLSTMVSLGGSSTKVLITVGGWNFNLMPGYYVNSDGTTVPSYNYFSEMVSNSTNYNNFIASVNTICTTYGTVGVDIDWEFPGVTDRGGTADDYQNYINFAKAFKMAHPSLLLTAAVPANAPSGFAMGTYLDEGGMVTKTVDPSQPQSYIDWLGYMSQYFDWYNIMTYDYYGAFFTSYTGENSPLYPLTFPDPTTGSPVTTLSIQASISGYQNSAASPATPTPAEKIVVGFPTYGRNVQNVKFPSKLTDQPYGPGCAFNGAGPQGTYTQQPGMLAYFEFFSALNSGYYTHYYENPVSQTSYAINITAPSSQGGPYWISIGSPQSAVGKGQWIKQQGLGGGMVYSIDMDYYFPNGTNPPNENFPLVQSFIQGLTQ